MGSILVFAFIQIFTGFLVLGFLPCIGRIKIKWILKNLTGIAYLTSTLNFIHGTFFEILVCVSISLSSLKFAQYLNTSDWVSVYLSIFFGVILLVQILFVAYFTIFKTKGWV